eukprot:GFYU01041553.1.p1 GENE.GFYU01041553.1~~GFYU01041553.1.p1  ORF type:complete len:363 (-),score=88.97 GFYU01041553.1:131-1219(-)
MDTSAAVSLLSVKPKGSPDASRIESNRTILTTVWSLILFWPGFIYRQAKALFSWVRATAVLLFVRIFLDRFIYRACRIYNVILPYVRKDVKLSEHKYGLLENEDLEVIEPTEPVEGATPVIYIHGGGFSCCNSVLVQQSVTPYARVGHLTFSINYPLAPENRFPIAIISVLKAMAWVRKKYGVDKVIMIGDSAGGNLVTMVTTLLCNKNIFDALAKDVNENIEDWVFPKIERVVSLYGLLDRSSWENEFGAWVIKIILSLYESRTGVLNNRITPLELEDEIKHFPPTFVVVGAQDPLLPSSRRFHRMLVSKGVDSKLSIYGGPHGFTAMPWCSSVVPARRDCQAFIKGGEVKKESDTLLTVE